MRAVAVRDVGPCDAEWPSGLDHLGDHRPPLLHVAGCLPGPDAVAVVGSRRCTAAGAVVAHELARDLAAVGISVVSGLARGIDSAAHRGSLEGGGHTTAVLAFGIDRCYPRPHERLRDEIAATGCLLTEYGPGLPPLRHHFLARNRLIAALVRAVVVVEAAADSGALSTARWARDLGREVLAVPANPRSPVAAGSNALLRDGATLCTGVLDVVEALHGVGALPAPPSPPAAPTVEEPTPAARDTGLGPAARRVLAALSGAPLSLDDLADGLRTPPAALVPVVAELDLAGLARPLPGGRVEVTAAGLRVVRAASRR